MNQKDILYIDDDITLLNAINRYLTGRLELDMDLANNLLTASKKIEKNKYSLILLDLQVPGFGENSWTVEFVKEIRRKGLETPIIYLTGDVETLKLECERLGVGYEELGIVGYLNKPFHPRELIDLIQSTGRFPEKRFHTKSE